MCTVNSPTEIREPARAIGIFGPSDSGKTKLGLYLVGLMPSEAVKCPPLSLPRIASRRDAVFVPTDPFLMFSGIKTTARDEFELSLQLTGIPLDDGRAAVANAVAALDLEALLDRVPFSLSGGEAMRLAIALAAVKVPNLMVLDQVYDSLAVDSVAMVRAFLKSETSRGCTTIEFFNRTPPWCQDYDEWIDLGVEERNECLAEEVQATPGRHVGGGPRLNVENVQFRYPGPDSFALGPVSMELRSGEFLALVGPNGAGKTTILKALARLITPVKGRIRLDGETIDLASVNWQTARRWFTKFLYVFQNPDDQIYCATVEDELAETARHSVAGGAKDRVALVVDQLGLTPYLGSTVSDLPRPIRRLVTLGSSLVANARVLLLDEPTADLDDRQCRRAGFAIDAYLEGGGSAIMVSHDMSFVERQASRRIIVESGKLK